MNEDIRLVNAAIQGDIKSLVAGLNEGANIEVRNAVGIPPLIGGVINGHLEVVELLIMRGADINAVIKPPSLMSSEWKPVDVRRGRTPPPQAGLNALIIAVNKGHIDIAKLLLQHKANINAKDAHGFTALHHAIRDKKEDMIRLLLENGARKDVLDRERKPPSFYAQDDDRILALLETHKSEAEAENKKPKS